MKKALAVLLCLVGLPLVAAEAQVSYSVDPGIIKIVVPPGGSRAGAIRVYARSRDAVRVNVYAGDWLYSDTYDGARTFLPVGTTALSCAKWISFSPADFFIPPYEVGTLNYVLKAPQDARGGYYAALFFETSLARPVEIPTQGKGVQTTSLVNLRLAAVFYVEIKGAVERSVELGKFSLSKDPRSKRYLMEADFKNTGNADTVVSGTFHILDSRGKIIARSSFRDAYSMPGDKAKVAGEWKGPLDKGKYDLVATLGLTADETERRITRGRVFTKEAEIEIGENGEVVSAGEFK